MAERKFLIESSHSWFGVVTFEDPFYNDIYDRFIYNCDFCRVAPKDVEEGVVLCTNNSIYAVIEGKYPRDVLNKFFNLTSRLKYYSKVICSHHHPVTDNYIEWKNSDQYKKYFGHFQKMEE